MFLFDLFETRARSAASFRRDRGASKPLDGDTEMERLASLPSTEPAELSAAGLATSDLSQ